MAGVQICYGLWNFSDSLLFPELIKDRPALCRIMMMVWVKAAGVRISASFSLELDFCLRHSPGRRCWETEREIYKETWRHSGLVKHSGFPFGKSQVQIPARKWSILSPTFRIFPVLPLIPWRKLKWDGLLFSQPFPVITYARYAFRASKI
jgi:hypothetical protein